MTNTGWEGRILGSRYQIQELLGHGGMSSVYKAYDPNLKRHVAVKIIHTHLSAQPDFVERFEREAASVAKLRHTNIIQVHDFNHEDNHYYIVFEYIPGETLQDRLKRLNQAGQFMPIAEVKKIIISLAGAIDYAHGKDIVHRDIKPANVMLNLDNEPILMDFGITKIVGGGKHTATGITLGTAEYMSPEQVKGLSVDNRTDIYALGITLFEMLGGRSPFEANSRMAVMMMHVQNPVPDLREWRQDISPVFMSILKKALAKEPDNRYQRAADLARDMRWTQDEITLKADTVVEHDFFQAVDNDQTLLEMGYPTAPPPLPYTAAATAATPSVQPIIAETAPSPAPAQRQRGRTWLWAVIALALLAIAVGAIWFWNLRGPSMAERVAAAEALATARQYDAAVSAYETLLQEAPDELIVISGLHTTLAARAQAAIAQGEYDRAQTDFTRLLAHDPTNAALNLAMADLMNRQGRFADSLPYYETALKQDAGLTTAQLGAGWAAYNLGNYDRALAYFSDILANNPENIEAHAGQAKSYYALAWYTDALAPLQVWATKKPGEKEPYYLLGMAYTQLTMYAEAIPNYRRWLQLTPDSSEEKADTQMRLAWALLETKNYAEAIDLFAELTQSNPDLPAVYEGLGIAYWASVDPHRALEAYQNWARLDPESAAAHAAVARAARETGDLTLSIDSYNKALAIEERAEWYLGLGQALVSTEQYTQGLKAYERSWELNPEQAEAYRLAGWLSLQQLKDNEAALGLFQKAARYVEKIGPTETDVSIYVGMATAYRGLTQHRQAVAPLRTALELSPNNINALRLMALSYFNLKEYENAIIYFSRAVELEERPEFLTGLGNSHRLLSDCEKAIPIFERALALDPENANAADGLNRCRQ